MNFRIYLFALLVFHGFNVRSQIQRIAITDFENTSGIAKYNGLGKALGSMLISDIESNVSPKRIQLVERSQINKILAEQNFQKTPNVDIKTAVDFGKILGVKFLLVGDVFVMNESIIINARLVDTETAGIYLAEKIEGNLTQWLTLKTNLAKAVATKLNLPFQHPTMDDKEINPASILTFSQAIGESDRGNFEKANQIIETLEQFEPNFLYLADLKIEIEKLKKQVEENTKSIKILEKSGGKIVNPTTYEELVHNYYYPLANISEKAAIIIDIQGKYPEKFDQFLSTAKNTDWWPAWDDEANYQSQTSETNKHRYDQWITLLKGGTDLNLKRILFQKLMMNFLDFSFYKLTRDKTFEMRSNSDLNKLIDEFNSWNTLLAENVPANTSEFRTFINSYVKWELYYTLASYLIDFKKEHKTEMSTLDVLQKNGFTKNDFSLIEKNLSMTILPLDKNDHAYIDLIRDVVLRDYTLSNSVEILRTLDKYCMINSVFVSEVNEGKGIRIPDDGLVTSELLEKFSSVKLLVPANGIASLTNCIEIGVDPWGMPENTIEYYCIPNDYVIQMLKKGSFDLEQTLTIWVKPKEKSFCSKSGNIYYILVNITQ